MMKTTKKLLALVLALVLLATCALVVQAESAPAFSKTYTGQSYVAISGNAGSENVGKTVSIMLAEKDGGENPQDDQIGYIGNTTVDSEGNYVLEFYFDGFTYDEAGEVDNYEVLLAVVDEKMNQSVTKAEVVTDVVQFTDFDFSKFGEIVTQITNEYNLKKFKYTFVVGFYDENNKLLKTLVLDKTVGQDTISNYTYDDIPEGTEFAKAFLWESVQHALPIAAAESFDIKGYSEGRSAFAINFNLGINETERNFCWYDIAGIEDTKVQYAVKTSDDDLISFPEENATTVMADYQTVDMSHLNGLSLSGKPWTHNTPYTSSKATITGIESGETYVYRFGDKLGWLDGIYEFTAPDTTDGKFSFIVHTDEHSIENSAMTLATINGMRDAAFRRAEEEGIEIDFMYSTGDNVDYAYYEDGYTRLFDYDKLTSVPLVGVPGNHDIARAVRDDTSLYSFHFNNPNQHPDVEKYGVSKELGTNNWFEYGGVQFIGLVDVTMVSKNKSYIDLAVSECPDAEMRMLFGHYPFAKYIPESGDAYKAEAVYTYTHDSDGTPNDVLANNGIVLTFGGHNHSFMRSYLMKNGEIVNREQYFTAATNTNGYVADESQKTKQTSVTMNLGDGVVHIRNGAASHQYYSAGIGAKRKSWMTAGWTDNGSPDLDGKTIPSEFYDYYGYDASGNRYDTYHSSFTIITVETPEEGEYNKVTTRAYISEFWRDTENGHQAFEFVDTFKVDEFVMNIKK